MSSLILTDYLKNAEKMKQITKSDCAIKVRRLGTSWVLCDSIIHQQLVVVVLQLHSRSLALLLSRKKQENNKQKALVL